MHGKTLNLNKTTTNLKFLHQLGMMNLIYLMDLFEDYFEYITENMKL